MVAASGYISGTNGAFVQGLVVNYAQQQGAGYLDDPVAEGKLVEGTPLHAALHGLVACAGAAASSQSCGSGAAGAAASSVLTGLFSEASPDETEQQREAKRNLIVSLVTGLAANSPQLDATTANSAAGAAVDNNWLATQQLVQLKKEYEEADGVIEKAQVLGKWGYISSKQDVLTQFGLGKGLVQSGWSDVEGMAQFLADPMAGLEGLKALVTDAAAQNQMLDGMATKLKSQIDTMANALEQGGDENAIALGEEMGNLIWTVGSFATGVGGVAKGGVALAKAGIKVGTQQLEKMSYAGKLEIAAKAEVPPKPPVIDPDKPPVNEPDLDPIDPAPTLRTVEVSSGGKGAWTKEINKPQPNTIYKVDGNKTYQTDSLGRVERVESDLVLTKNDRNTYQQCVAGKCGIAGDEGGHLIASIFNGPGERLNLLPMNGNLNKGEWKIMENTWAAALKEGKSVSVKIEPIYLDSGVRPDGFNVSYSIGGDRPVIVDFANSPQGVRQ